MSRPSSRSNNESEQIQLIVLRSTGAKDQFSVSPSDSLQSLKAKISRSSVLGRIPSNDQRLFHLGRELKTHGRSLETLGVTRFGVHLVHLHTSRPPPPEDDFAESDDDVVEMVEGTGRSPPKPEGSDDDEVQLVEVRHLASKPVIDLADDDDDSDEEGGEEPPQSANRPCKRQRS